MFTSYLTQFHTGFAVLVTGNKTPTFSFALQYLTPPLEIGIQGRQVLPKFIQRTPEKRIGHEQSDVETQLADPAVYADGARSTELLKRFNELRDLTERLMEDMAALEEQIAAIEAKRADIDSMGDLA